jgi:alkanesulfonate monooxygenase SsuD/methylene tetrahydromethanopterin reductase-like flavin-dependent oxidoreductase (luciferase family)
VTRAAEEAGLEELWLWEDCFAESGVAPAAAVLGWTQRLRVGIGLLPVPLRNVAPIPEAVRRLDPSIADRAGIDEPTAARLLDHVRVELYPPSIKQ